MPLCIHGRYTCSIWNPAVGEEASQCGGSTSLYLTLYSVWLYIASNCKHLSIQHRDTLPRCFISLLFKIFLFLIFGYQQVIRNIRTQNISRFTVKFLDIINPW